MQAASTVIGVADGGFRLDHTWRLTPNWRAVSLQVERWRADDRRILALERDGGRWRVNGQRRPDLDGAEEPDLSVTPFCNTLPIRRLACRDPHAFEQRFAVLGKITPMPLGWIRHRASHQPFP
jgi:hypothetical protein